MKKLSYIIASVIIGFTFWAIDNMVSLPDLYEIKENNPNLSIVNKTVNRTNYDSLVEVEDGNSSLFMERVIKARLFSNTFPFESKEISLSITQELLILLNDSSSYIWGECGTPYYDEILVYYDDKDNEVGYTNIDFGGGVQNYPYRYLMKWGTLSPQRKEKIRQIKTQD